MRWPQAVQVGGRTLDRVLLGLLTVDGLVVGLLSIGYVYTRFWGAEVPLIALAAGVVNTGLLWLSAGLARGAWRMLPLLAWLAVLVVGAVPGPGSDIVLAADGAQFLPTLLLLVLGAGIPLLAMRMGWLDGPVTSDDDTADRTRSTGAEARSGRGDRIA